MLKASFAWRSPREALEKVPAKVSVSAVAHAARPVALERPAFLQKTGMTGAERGTAIHAFMQSVPFDGPAPDLDAEVRRQTDLQLLDPALADKLDLDAVRPFFASAVWRRIRLAKQILREEPFITALPAAEVTPAAGQGVPPRRRCWCRALPIWCWSLTSTRRSLTTRRTAAVMPNITLTSTPRS